MSETIKINYVEIPAKNIEQTKSFFAKAFGWSFIDYGPDYVAIQGAGLDGGFYKSDDVATVADGSVLVVLYSSDLENTLQIVEALGANIIRPVFDFPGGKRFHFADPNGNEFAVWSDVKS